MRFRKKWTGSVEDRMVDTVVEDVDIPGTSYKLLQPYRRKVCPWMPHAIDTGMVRIYCYTDGDITCFFTQDL